MIGRISAICIIIAGFRDCEIGSTLRDHGGGSKISGYQSFGAER